MLVFEYLEFEKDILRKVEIHLSMNHETFPEI